MKHQYFKRRKETFFEKVRRFFLGKSNLSKGPIVVKKVKEPTEPFALR